LILSFSLRFCIHGAYLLVSDFGVKLAIVFQGRDIGVKLSVVFQGRDIGVKLSVVFQGR
jgi:hypothetical protein